MIQVSAGLSFEWWNTGTDYGVQNVQLKGTAISLVKSYKIAVNSFLAEGGDSWLTFLNGTDRTDTQYNDQESLNAYITDTAGLSTHIDSVDIAWGRATEVSGPSKTPAYSSALYPRKSKRPKVFLGESPNNCTILTGSSAHLSPLFSVLMFVIFNVVLYL
ncbi:hypothetical protein Pelo_11189 [Pelomyxa schiedti]|nr:hypothetical protein Pelo_11189 [Pelomyxa schiedti]